jgi:hypothetical protein
MGGSLRPLIVQVKEVEHIEERSSQLASCWRR